MRTYTSDSGVQVRLKDESVDIANVAPGVMDRVINAAWPSYARRGAHDSFVVTSAHDGTHSPGSLHDGRWICGSGASRMTSAPRLRTRSGSGWGSGGMWWTR